MKSYNILNLCLLGSTAYAAVPSHGLSSLASLARSADGGPAGLSQIPGTHPFQSPHWSGATMINIAPFGSYASAHACFVTPKSVKPPPGHKGDGNFSMTIGVSIDGDIQVALAAVTISINLIVKDGKEAVELGAGAQFNAPAFPSVAPDGTDLNLTIMDFPFELGDEICTSIVLSSTIAGQATLTNLSRNNQTVVLDIDSAAEIALAGSSANCLVTCILGLDNSNLPDFGSVLLTDCHTTNSTGVVTLATTEHSNTLQGVDINGNNITSSIDFEPSSVQITYVAK